MTVHPSRMHRPLALLAVLTLSIRAAAAESAAGEPGPPPTSTHYLQYGVALAGEAVASAQDVCPERSAEAPCILGSGLGVAIRLGYRTRGAWYVGAAYEFSRQDPANLMRLAILQQLRAEARYYVDQGMRLTPYLSAGLGAAVYGNEWGADTGGVTGFLGGGVEFQLSSTAVVGAALAYRPFVFRGWTDGAGQRRADRYLGFGLAHIVGLEITMEIREPLARW
jgi:opacity protein-like surface antigen